MGIRERITEQELVHIYNRLGFHQRNGDRNSFYRPGDNYVLFHSPSPVDGQFLVTHVLDDLHHGSLGDEDLERTFGEILSRDVLRADM